MKICFITNVCTHYSVKLFELLSKKMDVEYYFIGGEESYWEKRNKQWQGNFKGEYLRGFFLLPKFRFTPRLLSVLFKKYDVVIKTIDDRFALPVTFLMAKLFGRPFIFWVGLWQHPQTFFHKISYMFTKMIYVYSDAIVVYGEHIKEYLMSLGIKEEKIFCASHAVDNSFFNKEVSADDKIKTRLTLDVSDKKILLYVGRLESCKGLEYLIEAAAGLRGIDYMVVFIGSGSQRTFLEEKCNELNVRNRFLEYVPNDQLYRYYAIADMFILPSISTNDFKEPWGLVINEAMNQGCPIITTDAVGAAAGGLVENELNGFVVPEKNADGLKGAITKLCSDELLRMRMSAHSSKKIKDWTHENMAQGFINAVEYAQQKRIKSESRKCYAQ